MRILLFVGLAALSACRQPPEERQAANMEAMANNAVDPGTGEALDNAANQLERASDNVADAADTAKKDLR